jgi:MurNAc alpha-1-phosphate uridylyltransferase
MRARPDSVMILAAGFGSRMGALVRTRPKPLLPVAGRALIDHALALADEAGISRKVVNLHYLGHLVRAHLSGRDDVAFSDETPEILETGGGLRAARGLLGGEAALTLNSDVVWTGTNPLRALAGRWQAEGPGGARALLSVAPLSAVRARRGGGDFTLDSAGRIVGRGGDWVYLGAQAIDLTVLGAMPEGPFSLNRVWDAMIDDGSLGAVVHHGGWCDVGHPEGITEAEAMLRAATAP